MNVLESLKKWSLESPEKIAWTFLGDKGDVVESYTYQNLHQTCAFLSHSLLEDFNLRAGDRVLLVFFPGLDFTVSLLACFMAGVIAVPVFPPDPRRLKKDLHHFVNIQISSGAQVVLTNSQYSFVKKVENLKSMFSTSSTKWPVLQWIQIDEIIRKGKSLHVNHKEILKRILSEEQKREIQHIDVAFLQYTSGSTSDPKGVMISHGNLAHNLKIIIHELRASPATINVSWLPQYHDMGLIGSYLGTIYCGGSGYFLSPISFLKDPLIWLKTISQFRGTHTQAPNFAFALVTRKFKESKQSLSLDLSSLQHMINAAEPVDFHAIYHFYQTFRPSGLPAGVVFPTYGLAEHTVFVCSGGLQTLHITKQSLEIGEIEVVFAGNLNDQISNPGPTESNIQVVVGCGYPSRNEGVRVVLADSTSGVKISRDCQVGEIWVDSPSKALGYWGQPEQSKTDFKARLSFTNLSPSSVTAQEEKKINAEDDSDAGKEFLRTGDLGFYYRDELFVCGRLKDLIIVGGSNHYPQDIERTVEQRCQQLRAGCSAAFSLSGNEQNEAVIYVAELKEGIPSGEYQSICDACREVVASEHGLSLSSVCLLAPRSVAKTTSGKIARAWCRKAFLGNTLQLLFRSDFSSSNSAPAAAGTSQEQGGSVFGYSALSEDEDGKKESAEDHEKRANNAVHAAAASEEGPQLLPSPSPSREVVARDTPLEALVQQLETALLQVSAQGPSELSAPIDRDAALLSLGLDSMTVVQFKGVLENRFFCDIPDEFLFTQFATLNELAKSVKAGTLTESQRERFEAADGKSAPAGGDATLNTIPVSHKEPCCPWFTCCY